MTLYFNVSVVIEVNRRTVAFIVNYLYYDDYVINGGAAVSEIGKKLRDIKLANFMLANF